MPLEGEASEPFDDDSTVGGTDSSEPSIKGKDRQEEHAIDKLVELPAKRGSRVTRYLFRSSKLVFPQGVRSRFAGNFFSSYRKAFAVIFTGNLTAFIILVAQARGAPSLPDVGTAASANLMVSLLFRQENFVNLVYEIFTCVPHSLPLSIRKRLAKVFHYGGCHSGCGVAAVVWYLLYTALATVQFLQEPNREVIVDMITSYVLLAMFCAILAGAHPRIRVRFHDYFEAAHRFAGWIALCTFWIHTFFAAENGRKAEGTSLGIYLVKAPSFWFLCVSTMCSVLSWSRLRRRDVFPEVLSDHATRLHFKYKYMKPFYGIKLSDKPLLEWHAFATIPDEDGEGFSVVVSNAGDWTKRNILEPPKKLWIRGYPLHGLLYTSKLFKRIVVVATGSGIGPCLSLLFADVTPRRVLWSTPNPETTYGDKVMNAVRKADPNAVVWNTRSQGRPDMVALTHHLYSESNAEAVFIISNPKVTRKVVYGMQTRGIAAYGAIFDS